jgi:hypothetical protein
MNDIVDKVLNLNPSLNEKMFEFFTDSSKIKIW